MHGTRSGPPALSRDLGLERRLTRALRGEVRFDAFTRGRFATDASIYQIMPTGVVFPNGTEDIVATLAIAREYGLPVIPRGAGTSQNGQPIGAGLIVDCSRHLNNIGEADPVARTVAVQPGVVLELLNSQLRTHGLFFPVEPSTASRCTIGGMTGNNACGARSLRYGKMVDNVVAATAILADGERAAFGPWTGAKPGAAGSARILRLADDMLGWRLVSETRSSACFRKCSAALAGTTSMRSCPSDRTSPICSSARKARSAFLPR